MKLYIKKIFCFLLGCFIIQIGCAAVINANIGGDSCVVFIQGISNTLNITVGSASYIFMFCALVLLLIFARNKISLGTFLATFVSGMLLDIANEAIQKLSIESMPFMLRILVVAISCVIISIGFSIQKTADLGVAPHDEIPFVISESFKIQYRWIRVGLDIIYLVVGYLLGGVFGLGTIVATLLLGPTIQFFLPIVERPVKKLLGNSTVIA